ncbi:hypothetical protein [Streptomyces sp. NPDC002402]
MTEQQQKAAEAAEAVQLATAARQQTEAELRRHGKTGPVRGR